MRDEIIINDIQNIQNYSELKVTKSADYKFRLKLRNQKIQTKMKFIFSTPSVESNIDIKIALYKSECEMPVEVHIPNGVKGVSAELNIVVYVMDEKSRANITPGMFIHDRDVQKAGHGLVIKNIKNKDLYYFYSRGIDRKLGEKLLIGF
ncbi:MAG: SufD family Fe-S cluster assembly protein [Candidatus Dojkabacteria bacterium]|nr:SufD family Fe-S cluster assembly protein [Candidatus Dojkabacteria bacterium]